jgi:hypothetical protein
MKAKSSEPMPEAPRMQRQAGEMPPLLAAGDSALPRNVEDLGELFLAELRSRRERLARWVELLHAEAGIQAAPARTAGRPRPQCRTRTGAALSSATVRRAESRGTASSPPMQSKGR